ncbi:MAG: Flp pilus assembly complex ATPase component [Desulfobacteraceae bacterium]|nr:Flp pilus assembly complex ATPase component [Desulfobacteraceae bacterium]
MNKLLAKRKKLGEMLLEAGLIDKDQLEKALACHGAAGKKLGQYMIDEEMVTEEAIVKLISDQLKIKRYDPLIHGVKKSSAEIFDVNMAQKLQAIPIDSREDLLTVAMSDPLDINALDHIELIADMEVEAVICTQQELNLLISTLYGDYAGKNGVMDNIQEIQEMDVVEDDLSFSEEQSATSLLDMAEEAPVIRLVNSILTQAVKEGASDIHLSPEKEYVEIRFRVDGKLHNIPSPPKSMFLSMVSRLKILANLDISVSRIPQDGRFTVLVDEKEINIRVSSLPTVYGENLVLRLLDTSAGIYSLEKLGVSPADIQLINKMIKMPHGMILCTGPTGSGKSTSLFAMLKLINTPDTNIITLEDPVEYRMEHIRQAQLNKKAGMTFASGLRSILRQDPDVIMIGEIRDGETAGVAVQAALTGHMVLSTVHTNDAAGAITRFVDMGIEPFLVSSVMLVSIAQRLIRKVCPHCKKSYKPEGEIIKFWGLEKTKDLDFVKATGCFKCKDTGYSGRTGLYEVLNIDEDVKSMILAGKSAQEITRTCALSGQLTTLKQDAAQKVASGLTTVEEAASAIMT